MDATLVSLCDLIADAYCNGPTPALSIQAFGALRHALQTGTVPPYEPCFDLLIKMGLLTNSEGNFRLCENISKIPDISTHFETLASSIRRVAHALMSIERLVILSGSIQVCDNFQKGFLSASQLVRPYSDALAIQGNRKLIKEYFQVLVSRHPQAYPLFMSLFVAFDTQLHLQNEVTSQERSLVFASLFDSDATSPQPPDISPSFTNESSTPSRSRYVGTSLLLGDDIFTETATSGEESVTNVPKKSAPAPRSAHSLSFSGTLSIPTPTSAPITSSVPSVNGSSTSLATSLTSSSPPLASLPFSLLVITPALLTLALGATVRCPCTLNSNPSTKETFSPLTSTSPVLPMLLRHSCVCASNPIDRAWRRDFAQSPDIAYAKAIAPGSPFSANKTLKYLLRLLLDQQMLDLPSTREDAAQQTSGCPQNSPRYIGCGAKAKLHSNETFGGTFPATPRPEKDHAHSSSFETIRMVVRSGHNTPVMTPVPTPSVTCGESFQEDDAYSHSITPIASKHAHTASSHAIGASSILSSPILSSAIPTTQSSAAPSILRSHSSVSTKTVVHLPSSTLSTSASDTISFVADPLSSSAQTSIASGSSELPSLPLLHFLSGSQPAHPASSQPLLPPLVLSQAKTSTEDDRPFRGAFDHGRMSPFVRPLPGDFSPVLTTSEYPSRGVPHAAAGTEHPLPASSIRSLSPSFSLPSSRSLASPLSPSPSSASPSTSSSLSPALSAASNTSTAPPFPLNGSLLAHHTRNTATAHDVKSVSYILSDSSENISAVAIPEKEPQVPLSPNQCAEVSVAYANPPVLLSSRSRAPSPPPVGPTLCIQKLIRSVKMLPTSHPEMMRHPDVVHYARQQGFDLSEDVEESKEADLSGDDLEPSSEPTKEPSPSPSPTLSPSPSPCPSPNLSPTSFSDETSRLWILPPTVSESTLKTLLEILPQPSHTLHLPPCLPPLTLFPPLLKDKKPADFSSSSSLRTLSKSLMSSFSRLKDKKQSQSKPSDYVPQPVAEAQATRSGPSTASKVPPSSATSVPIVTQSGAAPVPQKKKGMLPYKPLTKKASKKKSCGSFAASGECYYTIYEPI